MGVPVDADMEFRGASPNVKTTDDTTDIGGSPASGTLNESDPNLLFDATPAEPESGATVIHRNVFYRFLNEGGGGKAQSPKIYLVNGISPVASDGPLSFVAGAGDAGKKVLVHGQVGGVMDTELITLVDGSATGSKTFQSNEDWRWELLESDGETPAPADADIVGSKNGTDMGMIPADYYQATAEYMLAVATAMNTNLTAADRLTDPSGIGSYSRPIIVGSVNTALSLPDDFDDGDFCGIAVRKYLRKGILAPKLGYVKFFHNLRFSASA